MRPKDDKNRQLKLALGGTLVVSALVLWVALSSIQGSHDSWVSSWLAGRSKNASPSSSEEEGSPLPLPYASDSASAMLRGSGGSASPAAGPDGAPGGGEPPGGAGAPAFVPGGASGEGGASSAGGSSGENSASKESETGQEQGKPGKEGASGKTAAPSAKNARPVATDKKTASSAQGAKALSQTEKLLQEVLAEAAGLPASLRVGKVPLDAHYLKETPKDFEVPGPEPTGQEMAAAAAKAKQVAGEKALVTGMKLLAAAYHYLGIPYKLGGDGVRTTDCSMFTRMSAVSSGLEPKDFRRGAGNQYGYSLKKQYEMQMVDRDSAYYGIDLSRLVPGDFLFFNWRNEFCRVRPYGVGHVAFYIGPTKGKRAFVIHAGNPVKKTWIDTKYLVGVGRIVEK